MTRSQAGKWRHVFWSMRGGRGKGRSLASRAPLRVERAGGLMWSGGVQVAARAQGGGLQRASVRRDAAQRAAQRGARPVLAPARLGGCAAVRACSVRRGVQYSFVERHGRSALQHASSLGCLPSLL